MIELFNKIFDYIKSTEDAAVIREYPKVIARVIGNHYVCVYEIKGKRYMEISDNEAPKCDYLIVSSDDFNMLSINEHRTLREIGKAL